MKKHFTNEYVRNGNMKQKKEDLNKFNEVVKPGSHGITLIALVITIIVILIQ